MTGSQQVPIDWAACGRPFAGESESGDLHVATAFPGGALVGVIDGLGHGKEAARAAHAAAAVLNRDPGQLVKTLVEACHEALRGTRGVVLSLASINALRGELTWVGVGNVEAVLYRANLRSARDRIVQRNGVVGFQLPALRVTTLPIFRGDVLVFASDGIGSSFTEEAPSDSSSQAYAARLLREYGKADDDALVLVVRYLGATS